jgi:hypothetical protein
MEGSSGSHLDQGHEGGANGTKANGSHLEPGPNVPGTKKTSVRGGGTKAGHSKDPAAKKSGSKNAQHPNVNAKGGRSGTFLGK